MTFKESLKEVLFSILPLALVVLILQFIFLDFNINQFVVFSFGVLLSIIGFTLFIIGAETGLLYLGEIIGISIVNKAKIWFIIAIAISLGFAVTVAEPGVQLLAAQADIVKEGFITKYLLIIIISLGVGIYLCLALLRLVFNVPLKTILFISYFLAFILIIFADAKFITLAFDASGVTTGPMAVPFILALGFGMTTLKGIQKTSDDNFGFVALASIGPILTVLLLGVIL